MMFRFLFVFLLVSGGAHALVRLLGFNMFTATLLMWSVGVAAMLALRWAKRPLSDLGWGWGPARYHVIAFVLPLIYGGIAYTFAGVLGLADFPNPENARNLVDFAGFKELPLLPAMALTFLLLASSGLVNSMSTALGEEIGWRGLLTPLLTQRWGFIVATLATGLFWASWHMPLIFFSAYNAGGEQYAEALSFLCMIVSISGPMAWLRLKSGSLWPAAMLHATHNLFIQSFFDQLSNRGESTITMVGEFGVILAGAALLVSLPFWLDGARRFSRQGSRSPQEYVQ